MTYAHLCLSAYPQVQHTWQQVDDVDWEELLVRTIQQDPDYQQEQARILVFARDVTSTDKVSASLPAQLDLACFVKH